MISGSVLLAEDNPVIALEIEQYLLNLGASNVFVTGDVLVASEKVKSEEIDLAVLDIRLKDESCEAIAYQCLQFHIPFIFASGYGRHAFDPKVFGNIPYVVKPFGQQQLARTLKALAATG